MTALLNLAAGVQEAILTGQLVVSERRTCLDLLARACASRRFFALASSSFFVSGTSYFSTKFI